MNAPSRTRRVSRLLGGMIAAVVVSAAACGIPVSDEVELLPPEEHEALLNGTTTTTEPEPEPEETRTNLDLYFIGEQNQLEVVRREFAEPNVNDALAGIAVDPLPEELDQFEDVGLVQSFIPSGLEARAVVREEGESVQRIDVNPAGDLRLRLQEEPAEGRLIVSQIVCTILNLPRDGVGGVVIFDDQEEPLQLSDSNGEPIAGPATVEDFNDCRTGADERLELLEEEGVIVDDDDATTTTEG